MKQRVITLLYHDVIDGDDPDVSGFSGNNPAEYKLSVNEFKSHLHAISGALKGPVISPGDIGNHLSDSPPVLLSFDDGGVSAYEHIAPMLEGYNWRGCFFITTDRIDTAAFVTRKQIKELHQRGHTIGSHSCSHPRKISECSKEDLLDEWRRSLAVLSEILGERVTVASVPGGFYSRKIAETAAESGVKILFTSEPVQRIVHVDGCAVIGRFSVKRGMGPVVPAEFVQGNRTRRFRQFAYWNLKKTAKAVSGPVYPWVRSMYLSRKQA
jgi:peptidoglycan/xylan/chitin deacetylase (PgdA/CDA1 family)